MMCFASFQDEAGLLNAGSAAGNVPSTKFTAPCHQTFTEERSS